MFYKIEKLEIPLIWLDTFVLSNMAKLKNGKNLSILEKEKIENLYSAIKKGVNEYRFFCAEGDQNEEYETGYVLPTETKRIQMEFSYGIRLNHREEIKRNQTYHGLQKYITKKENISLPIKCFFRENILEEINKVKKDKLIISARMPFSNLLITEFNSKKKSLGENLENQRQRNLERKMDYEKQKRAELESYFPAIIKRALLFSEKRTDLERIVDLSYSNEVNDYLSYWKELIGKRPSEDEICDFFSSQYFFNLPFVNIQSTLFADLLTGSQRIKDSDSMDVQQLASVLPISSVIIIDSAMKEKLKRRKLIQDYGCVVFTWKEIDKCIKFLNNLRPLT